MCRLAAFPPGFSRQDALDVLQDMEGFNRDGVGWAYVRPDGFHVGKYASDLQSLLRSSKKGPQFLSHMPHDGWTIVHLRMATHGGAARQNTHPFTAGEWCVMHNGVWMGYIAAKLALSRSVRFHGDTDSEVAAHLINVVGPKPFAERIIGGVFLALNRNGDLWALKTSGELEYLVYKGATLIASALDLEPAKVKRYCDGWYHFNARGKLVDKKVTSAWGDTSRLYRPRYNPRYGTETYEYGEHFTAGNDEPSQAEIADGAYGWYYDVDQNKWVKRRDKIGGDGFPIRPRYAGGKEIEVPRDRDLPRYPPLPEAGPFNPAYLE